jgi:hypothetical protein
MRLSCFGYRNTQKLEIRDETADVVQRVHGFKKRTPKGMSESVATSATGFTLQTYVSHRCTVRHGRERISLGITAPPLEVVLGYFLFVFSQTSPFSYLAEHIPLIADDKSTMQAVYAPALAALSLQYRSTKLMCEARSHYIKILQQTNRDLCDPHKATLDNTLLCVLLLSAFEALTFSGRSSPQSWRLHIQGATKLLVLRGATQTKTELGCHLTYHTVINTLTNCILNQIPVPADFRQLLEHPRLSEDAPIPFGLDRERYRFVNVMMRVNKLRAGMKGMLATKVVAECLTLDTEAAHILDKLIERAPFRIVDTTSDNEEFRRCTKGTKVYTFKGVIHIYNSQSVARTFNEMWLMRIVLNEWIFCAFEHQLRGVILDEPPTGTSLHMHWAQLPGDACSRAAKIIDNMLAGLPYSLELLPEPFRISARSIIWPLVATAGSEVCPIAAKLFIIDRLKELARLHELDQAKEAATMLEEGVPIESW